MKKKIAVSFNIDPDEYAKAIEIAEKLGYTYGDKGQVSKLLSAIAKGELILIKSTKN